MRSLWIARINAGARMNGLSYSRLMHGLKVRRDRPQPQGACRSRSHGCQGIQRTLREGKGRNLTHRKSLFPKRLFFLFFLSRSMVILSKNNPQVRELRALREKKARKEAGSFLVEGEKMVKECLASGIRIKRIVAREDYRGELSPDLVLGSDAFSSISEEKTPQPVLAEAELPHTSLCPPMGSCLVLDGLQDPANVGAIIRTANAAGYHELYLIGCADPFSPEKRAREHERRLLYKAHAGDAGRGALRARKRSVHRGGHGRGKHLFLYRRPKSSFSASEARGTVFPSPSAQGRRIPCASRWAKGRRA